MEYAQQPLTTPLSPNKRRRILQESSETDGEMSIERYLYRLDKYRTRSSENPWPFPFKLERPREEIPCEGTSLTNLKRNMHEILWMHGFESDKTYLSIGMAAKPGYPEGNIPVPAVVIAVDGVCSPRLEAWSAAQEELKSLLNDNGFGDVLVEIYNEERSFTPFIEPLLPTDPVIEAYEKEKDSIVECLDNLLGQSWAAMSLFKYGLGTTKKLEPALVIYVRPRTIQDWRNVGDNMRDPFLEST
ncbi:hypothetical protein AJ79_08144 [Helicocarpus griseus UAMH5409]|uniref:Uncharacterized protein n=1 Tax=Helicocarpus griseus UAMH5409 TaxID=1447875 RepID=A0A2B7WW06_9EURO|nr:hypothetical protein AJ79_08144 [Helicocarpus griseus UAMH5409]